MIMISQVPTVDSEENATIKVGTLQSAGSDSVIRETCGNEADAMLLQPLANLSKKRFNQDVAWARVRTKPTCKPEDAKPPREPDDGYADDEHLDDA